MGHISRHQCLIYEGSPAGHLPALVSVIQQKLKEAAHGRGSLLIPLRSGGRRAEGGHELDRTINSLRKGHNQLLN